MAAKPKSDYTIQTVSNALHMLEAFRGEGELGVSELSRRLRLHKNNVFRLLATLEHHGYIEQSETNDQYRLGVRCLELGRSFSGPHELLRRARPILQQLAAAVGETAHLALLSDHQVVHLDGVQSGQMLVTALRVGERLPSHCTALGKVLLGCGEIGVQESMGQKVRGGFVLERRTPTTLVDLQKLFDELRTVSAQGFAVDLGECEEGLHCVAAPVRAGSGQTLAALSVSGPALRLPSEALHANTAGQVVAAADRLSLEIGSGL
ncbi:MAG: IclR family transcriptional regulator [Myxococcota bacterium]